MTLTFGSLFSGIGGLDLGLERAGMRCVWQVEIDEFCRRVLAKHWPNVRRHDDVRTFPPNGDWHSDCIVGGFPCKQTSTGAAIHGRRCGLDGEDSGLWFAMLHALRILRPSWVVVENVAGAAKWNATIKGGLADIGYRVPDRPVEVSAESIGAPHSRRRLFWIADLNGKGLAIARQGGPSAIETRQRRAADGNTWLENIPGAWGMDDGAADRVDRLNGIGNAVVPQVAQWIGERIMECERQKESGS